VVAGSRSSGDPASTSWHAAPAAAIAVAHVAAPAPLTTVPAWPTSVAPARSPHSVNSARDRAASSTMSG
jgi:hypothetical protein